MGLEPTTSELEVQRAIRCATAAMMLRKTQILSNPNSIFIRQKNFTQTFSSTVTFAIAKSFKFKVTRTSFSMRRDEKFAYFLQR